jgi:hypothetical protein
MPDPFVVLAYEGTAPDFAAPPRHAGQGAAVLGRSPWGAVPGWVRAR